MVSPTPHQTNPRVARRFRDDSATAESARCDASDPKPDAASRIAAGIERRVASYPRDRSYRRDRHSALPTLTPIPKKIPLRLPKYKRRI